MPRELIPIVLFNVIAVIGLAFSPIGRAIARRIGGHVEEDRQVAALRDEVEQLRGELDDVHRRLAEVDDLQSRLDFAERVLAQVKDKAAIPGPR